MTDDKELETPPDGWVPGTFRDTFADRAGPYYWRVEGGPGVGFFSKPHHANLGSVIHGGALLTLADMVLFAVCRPSLENSHAVTVSLNSEFLNPGPIGVFIHGEGETVKAGKSLMVARGTIYAADLPLLSFSGVLKKISKPAPSDLRELHQR